MFVAATETPGRNGGEGCRGIRLVKGATWLSRSQGRSGIGYKTALGEPGRAQDGAEILAAEIAKREGYKAGTA
jgi:hypothetical protein